MRLSRYELHPLLYAELQNKLYRALFDQDNFEDLENLAQHIFTPTELEALGKRLEILKLLRRDLSYMEIREKVKVTNATINKMANILKKADQEFIKSLDSSLKADDEESKRQQQSKYIKGSKRLFPKKL